jgi:predicted phosphodiesterase
MIIDGNHDSRALPILRNIFSTRLRKTPVQCDGIIYAHGHEAALDFSHAVDDIGQLVIPISASLRTMGFRIDDTSSSNWEIAHHLAPSGTFIIFGHTHKPELAATYANTGCFLRRGPQSLITLEGSALSLWQRKIL